MFEYISYNISFREPLRLFYNEVVEDDGIYEPVSEKFFLNNFENHPEFDPNGVFICIEGGKILGFIMCHVRGIEKEDDNKPGYISTILVRQEYRRMGIGSKLLNLAYDYLKSLGKKKALFGYTSTLNWPWYIPNTSKHDHNGAPGIMVNSDFYLFLFHKGYNVVDEEDAFHLDLKEFKMPDIVKNDLAKLKEEKIIIELYDPNIHYGIDEFYDEIKSEPFERVIRYNLSLNEPKPFAVVSENGKVAGWTGAFYTEESGRAHFDGIIVAPHMRGKGLGRALFATLAEYSKTHGSVFMTFFTGRTNFARYIYMSLGFKIIKSFALMEIDIS